VLRAGFALAGGTGWSLTQGLGSGGSDAFQGGGYGSSGASLEHWMSIGQTNWMKNTYIFCRPPCPQTHEVQ
jgi:hypothetical protein